MQPVRPQTIDPENLNNNKQILPNIILSSQKTGYLNQIKYKMKFKPFHPTNLNLSK